MQYGTGTLAPAPPVAPPQGIQMSWIGWDGSEWMLTDYSGLSGVVMQPTLVGLEMPDFTLYTNSSDSRHGAIRRGYRANVRSIEWNLFLYSDSSPEWVRYQSAFLDTMHPDRPGTWQVKAPGCQLRSLTCHLSKMATGYPNDPAWQRWSMMALELVADDDPFWQGPPVVETWKSFTPLPWFAPAGQTPPGVLNIIPNNSTTSAVISNLGDVEGWVFWTANGPLDAGLVLGVGSGSSARTVTIPFALGASDVLTIDTDPQQQVVLVNGVDRTADLTTRPQFAPISPGDDAPLTVTMSGSGSVTGVLIPRYFRAW